MVSRVGRESTLEFILPGQDRKKVGAREHRTEPGQLAAQTVIFRSKEAEGRFQERKICVHFSCMSAPSQTCNKSRVPVVDIFERLFFYSRNIFGGLQVIYTHEMEKNF